MHGILFPAGLDAVTGWLAWTGGTSTTSILAVDLYCHARRKARVWLLRQCNMKVQVEIIVVHKTKFSFWAGRDKKYSNWAGTEAPRFSSYATCLSLMIAKRLEHGAVATVFSVPPVNSNML